MTFSRETGSQGHYIAEKVTKSLGFHLADKYTIGRLCTKYGSNEFGIDTGYVPDFWTDFDARGAEHRERMVNMLNQVILALAHYGNMVILGRSSFAVLNDFDDVLNVRIQAPLSLRIQRVMQRGNLVGEAQAIAIVNESDRVRNGFIQWFYGSKCDTTKAFDLVIDTGKIPVETTIKWLVEAGHLMQARNMEGLHTSNQIHVDPILTTMVAEEFEQHHARKRR
jgi:cytidylate kinase